MPIDYTGFAFPKSGPKIGPKKGYKLSPIKKGKKTTDWEASRKELKKEYQEKRITSCELQLSGCWKNKALSFAHRYKRKDSRTEHSYEQTLLACVPCHQKIEYDRELTEKMFKKLRKKSVDK